MSFTSKHTSDLRGRVVHVNSGMEFDYYVGRANKRYNLPQSALANPFKIDKHGSREHVLWCYREKVEAMATVSTDWREQLASLHGKTLACWCAPKDRALTLDDPEVCHAQVLLRLAQELTDE